MMTIPDTPFEPFPKMGRLSREIVITEKLDGTNSSVFISDEGTIHAGSRTKWITPEKDNYGFARWVWTHKDELMQLGPGLHMGEWWGSGIQRGYGLKGGDKRFSLFNTIRFCLHDQEPGIVSDFNPLAIRYQDKLPACCSLVPELYRGIFTTDAVEETLKKLEEHGSYAAPFSDPEGVVVWHVAGQVGFKKTLGNDGHKGTTQTE